MEAQLTKAITPQAQVIYDLLIRKGEMDAEAIGRELDILPNAVYRAANKLITVGMARKLATYPAKFAAVPAEAALSWYLLATAQQFRQQFNVKPTQRSNDLAPSITVIKDRNSLLVRTDKDAARAKQSIDYIVSGLEVPDETVMVYRQAVARGVRVRKLVQRQAEISDSSLAEWRRNGIDVRLCPDLGTRMFIFDERIVYLTSYSVDHKDRAFGIRFDYPPLAVLLRNLFKQYWSDAKD
jgi:sugar-specific transcriptional regulator TrmB